MDQRSIFSNVPDPIWWFISTEQPKGVIPPGPIASTASTLAKRYGVPESDVEEIISKNPGLTEEEYALLVQYYRQSNTILYDVTKIFTLTNSKGKSVTVYSTLPGRTRKPSYIRQLSPMAKFGIGPPAIIEKHAPKPEV